MCNTFKTLISRNENPIRIQSKVEALRWPWNFTLKSTMLFWRMRIPKKHLISFKIWFSFYILQIKQNVVVFQKILVDIFQCASFTHEYLQHKITIFKSCISKPQENFFQNIKNPIWGKVQQNEMCKYTI